MIRPCRTSIQKSASLKRPFFGGSSGACTKPLKGPLHAVISPEPASCTRAKDVPKPEIKGSVPRRHQADCHCHEVAIQVSPTVAGLIALPALAAQSVQSRTTQVHTEHPGEAKGKEQYTQQCEHEDGNQLGTRA